MKSRSIFLFVSILLILLLWSNPVFAISGTPHILYGKVFNAVGTSPQKDYLETHAYILKRPGELLDKTSVGCGYELDSLLDGWLWFESGNFISPWALDETVRIIAVDTILQETGFVDLILDSSGNQRIPDIHLSYGDHVGPIASHALVNGMNPASIPEGTISVALSADLDDSVAGNSNIQLAEYFIDNDPGYAAGTPMEASDGIFDSPHEGVRALVNTSSWTEGSTHTIYIRGYDISGNWGTQDSVAVEVTGAIPPPSVSLYPVTSPTNMNGQVLTGTMEQGATVSVTCPTATVGAVTYPTATTWTAALSNMREGSSTVTVTASYANMNVSSSLTATIVVDTVPPSAAISGGPSDPTNNTSASFSFTSNEADSTFQCRLDGGSFAACTSPVNYTGLTEGSHTFSVKATDAGGNIELTPPTYTWTIDTTPPTGTIAINNHNAYTGTPAVTLTLNASDGGGSGVAKMCVSNTDSCTVWENYAETKAFTLSPGDGAKTVYVWYKDNLGNTDTVPYSASITLDTTAPVLTVSTLSDSSWTNNELLNISGQVTDNSGIQQFTINDVAVAINPDGSFSYPLVLQDGPNTVNVRAIDIAGNEASDTRTINLDRNAPMITIATPADNMKTNQSSIDVTGTVYEESTITVKVNDVDPVPAIMNGYNFSLTVTPVYGINTIEVTATDLAGNTSSIKRTITFDDQNPSLSVTNPAQDTKTNQADMIIRGEAGDDLTAVTVTITKDGNIYAPVVTGGHFEQPVTFTEEKAHQIYVKAVDEAGNETTVQRNIVYDTTAPSVTLDPVTSPANLNSQVLSGTMEEGATVSVACPTATVGAVTYPTATTWTATLSDMQEGDNPIAVIATDEVGNTSSPILATITVSMIPVITVSPVSATNEVGHNYTVTATLSDILGNPKPSNPVTFSVISGPNTGAAGICSVNADCTTDANGLVSFTYSGLGSIGIDQIIACFINQAPGYEEICSQAATNEWTYPVCDALSDIASNFNGTQIAADNYIWFNSIVKVSGVGSNPATIRFVGSKIQFSANGQNYELSVPGTEIVYSPTATMATTEFIGGKWFTTVPLNYTGNVFLAGLAFIVPAGGLPGGINPVTWSGYFMTDTPGITAQWKWAAAVYTQFSPGYNSLGVKPIDGSQLNEYNNSDHAGTPEYYKPYVIGGARGGGGSNYTGGYSGTTSKTPCPF